jgi:heme-degrading monooxygenase HmoA
MIARHWKGIVKPELADKYIDHLKTDTYMELSKIDGFVEASILMRSVEQGTEFCIVTVWESMEAIERFAGVPPDVAVVPEKARAMMITFDAKVAHYEVMDRFAPA